MTQTVKTLLFLAAAVVVIVVAFLVRPGAPTADSSDLNQPFFPDFTDPLAAVSFEVVKIDSATASVKQFKVAQQDGLWVIPSHENYPADAAEQMKESASLLIGLKRLGAVSGDKTEHEKFGVIDPGEASVGGKGVGTLVRIADKDGRDLARLIIGNDVNEQPGQHYVRVPGSDRVYVAAIDDKSLTTAFADWIERDLLDLDQFDIRRIKVDNYTIDETEGRPIQGDILELTVEAAGENQWKLKGLKEEEELNKKKLDDLRAAIDHLNIVDVERKPEMLVNNLRAGREMFKDMENPANRVIFGILQTKGFFAVPVEVLNKTDWLILSNEGELIVGLQNGVEYVLRFGEITREDVSESNKQKKDEKAGDAKTAEPAPKQTGSNRYMYVVARLNEGLIQKPELLIVPEWKEPAKEPVKPQAAAPIIITVNEKNEIVLDGKTHTLATLKEALTAISAAAADESPEQHKTRLGQTPVKVQGARGAAFDSLTKVLEVAKECGFGNVTFRTTEKPDAPNPDEKKGCDETGETKPDVKKSDEKKPDETKPDPALPLSTPAPTTPVPPTPPTVEQQKAAHEAMAKAIAGENERRQKEYNAKIDDAKKRVAQLNARFAPWYYVISDAEFKKMRLTRKDVVSPNKALLNKRAGEAFLAANKTREGVITTASGLQYKVIKEGTGKTPKATDEVAVAYKGTLIDGTVFDESKPGRPAEFSVDGVIAGWTEALQLMKEGGKLQLFIPGDLAYKEKGHGDTIGPNQTLLFEVELVKVK